MGKVQVSALRSGSSGNIYLVEDGKERVLVDCGVNGRQFKSALEAAQVSEDEIRKIHGLVITHEHSDHICGLGVIMRRYHLPVYMSRGTYEAARKRLGKVDESLVHFVEAGESFTLANFEIAPYAISHDAREPLGFTFSHQEGKIAFCTDTGVVDAEILAALEGSNIVFMEANYEPDLLACGPYPWYLKERIRSEHGHLSNQRAGEICRILMEGGSQKFVLSHLSQENNFPQIAHMVARDLIAAEDAQEDRDFKLYVARRYQNTEAVSL